MKPRSANKLVLCVLLAFCLWLLLYINTTFWNGCGECHYLDIHTGRTRCIEYIVFIKTRDEIKDTDISRLWSQYFGVYPKAYWTITARFPLGYGNHSIPDYPAMWRVKSWELELYDLTKSIHINNNSKKEIVSSVIQYLENQDAQSCNNYLNDLTFYLYENRGRGEITNHPLWIDRPEHPYKQRYLKAN